LTVCDAGGRSPRPFCVAGRLGDLIGRAGEDRSLPRTIVSHRLLTGIVLAFGTPEATLLTSAGGIQLFQWGGTMVYRIFGWAYHNGTELAADPT
jgi:hypothetical protein